MSVENINIEIELSETSWSKHPQYSIWFDNQVVEQSEISSGRKTIKFTREIEEGPHSLSIRLENKDPSDTVIDDNQIVKDMLLNIEDIRIDDITLGNLLWFAQYKLDQPQQYNGKIIDELSNCVNLGWNGTYTLTFNSPFYIWLLEKL